MYITFSLIILVALFLLHLTDIKVIASWNANEIISFRNQPTWQCLGNTGIF